jgi:hypothetical protein
MVVWASFVTIFCSTRNETGDSCDDVGLVFLSDFGDLVWLLSLATLFGDLVLLSCDDVGLVFLSDFGDLVWLLCLATLFGYFVWRLSFTFV